MQCRRHIDAGSIPGLRSPLEEEMATHSSVLAWKTPQAEEPGGLQFIGLKRWTWMRMHAAPAMGGGKEHKDILYIYRHRTFSTPTFCKYK